MFASNILKDRKVKKEKKLEESLNGDILGVVIENFYLRIVEFYDNGVVSYGLQYNNDGHCVDVFSNPILERLTSVFERFNMWIEIKAL